MLKDIIKDNQIIIIPSNIKKKIIKLINSFDKLYNVKIYTIEEIKKNLLFEYDEKTIKYVMNKNGINYDNAVELIKNMYYLFDEIYENSKINNLNILKKELEENNLIYQNPYFKNSMKNKEIIVYGFDYLNRFNLKLLDMLKINNNLNIIPKEKHNYEPIILKFEHLNYEIEYIANDIISKNLDFNKVYIYGINNDNIATIKRIFSNYHININLPSNISLYETLVGKNYLDGKISLDEIKNNDIKDLIINIENKYTWLNQDEKQEMISYEFKNTKIPSQKYQNAVNETKLFNEIFNDDDYIYIIGFNNEYIPMVYKDTDFINDKEKFDFLETTDEKNIIQKELWHNILSNIKNLTITLSNQNYNGSLNISSLVNDYEYKNIDVAYNPSIYSNKSNIYNTGILLDKYQKTNILDNNLLTLLNTYPNNNYQKYQNDYCKIKLKDDFNYTLSYTKLDTFYKCPFKFYCDYILKINTFENTFEAYLGSLSHYILSKIYDDNFDLETVKNEFLRDNPFNLTDENLFFIDKTMQDLDIVIKHLKQFNNITKYNLIETEKDIIIDNNGIIFDGKIDKIMHYNDNVVIVDYKTNNIDIDLRLASRGINLQLPIYLYLIKQIYPTSHITGIYLNHILKPSFNYKNGITALDQFHDSLKLSGYTLGCEDILKDFDPTYENSDYIAGLKLGANGFSSKKVISENDFLTLEKLADEKIKEAIKEINAANFNIEPKIIGKKEISCEYCPYKSICFKKDNNIKYLSYDNNLLGGTNEEHTRTTTSD